MPGRGRDDDVDGARAPKVLEKRGITVTPAQRETIAGCRDVQRIEAWLDRAIAASSADELFAGG